MSQATQYKDILDTFTDGFPLLQKVYEVYEKSPSISGDQENTLRRSVEMTTLEILELIVVAARQGRTAKADTLRQALSKLDTLKVFVDLASQTGLVKEDHHRELTTAVTNVGKMIGGWVKSLTAVKKEEVK